MLHFTSWLLMTSGFVMGIWVGVTLHKWLDK